MRWHSIRPLRAAKSSCCNSGILPPTLLQSYESQYHPNQLVPSGPWAHFATHLTPRLSSHTVKFGHSVYIQTLATPPMPFTDLAADVIILILSCCDIVDVVSTAKTCRYLHTLAFGRSVWLALLQDLGDRRFLDSAHRATLHHRSTDELIALVKRILAGPATWSPDRTSGGFTPAVSREIILHPTIRTGVGILDWENEAKLLPGGAHVLFKNWRTLECWSVAEDRLVWTHKPHPTLVYASVLEFAAEVVDGGHRLIVLICERTYPQSIYERTNYIEIVELDLREGTSELIAMMHAPDTSYDNPFSYPVLSGDIAAVAISGQNQYLIINWRTKCRFLLRCRPRPFCRLALIPRYIIFTSPFLIGMQEIHVIDIDAVEPLGLF
ncbi:hypothetical protein B0H10DRAFT_1327769 [Mycena sp. CBHHK59/15]|nr:hypothetical protein B0H10DRAFT_1327769 [Mycena sp. CBHHK59/15]